MVKYRRYHAPGGTYFFTVALQDRQSNNLTQHIRELGAAIRHVKILHPFKTIAMVALPDHLHAMWQLPDNDTNFSLRWRCIKTAFTSNIKNLGLEIPKNKFDENYLWQKRFWEHAIRDEKDYENHVNYIHYNPVKHGLVSNVYDWPYSTFHRYVRAGIIPRNWSCNGDDIYGE